MMMQHPDDEEFYSGTWADQFATYDDACRYYGCDTPAQAAAEEQWHFEEWALRNQDELEARCQHVHPYVEGVGDGIYWGEFIRLQDRPVWEEAF